MNGVEVFRNELVDFCKTEFSNKIDKYSIRVSRTNPDFSDRGDYSFNYMAVKKFTELSIFDIRVKIMNATTDIINRIGNDDWIVDVGPMNQSGFINIKFGNKYWVTRLHEISINQSFGTFPANEQKVVLEYCGPNTNKPLHIGHVRNMLLGYSMSEILKASGHKVTKVNIYNDRGIAICKSMVAYQRYGNGTTPQSTDIKGDHFVGDWYVKFNEVVNEELKAIANVPADKDEAQKLTPIFKEAQEMLLKWEAGDEATMKLWKQMNGWVYDGFKVTFNTLGVDFQKDYFESETYKLGKDIIEEGIQKKVYYKKPDGSVAVDLTAEKLDEKILLRADGTSLYITQDIATAQLRYEEFKMDKMIYVVANEQDYHFKVLKLALQKLGKTWADGIYHLSYALVESPTGRFKSREGKTADADDLISEVLRIAEEKTKELGKIEGFTDEQAMELYRTIGLGALKYFILRVNPYKKIIFNPEESIDFHGHTGPFIQYTHARICAILRKASSIQTPSLEEMASVNLADVERELIIQISEYENILRAASDKYDPSEIANYVYSLAKSYNKFYHEQPVLTAEKDAEKKLRILLSKQTGRIIKQSMNLLGIGVPEKM